MNEFCLHESELNKSLIDLRQVNYLEIITHWSENCEWVVYLMLWSMTHCHPRFIRSDRKFFFFGVCSWSYSKVKTIYCYWPFTFTCVESCGSIDVHYGHYEMVFHLSNCFFTCCLHCVVWCVYYYYPHLDTPQVIDIERNWQLIVLFEMLSLLACSTFFWYCLIFLFGTFLGVKWH